MKKPELTNAEKNYKVDMIECVCKLLITCGAVLAEKEGAKE